MCFGSSSRDQPDNSPAPRPVHMDDTHAAKPPVYSPPSGPPPSRSPLPASVAAAASKEDYAPPVGPPPARAAASQEDYAPPAGPPPSAAEKAAPPAHDWEIAVPDTALLPPPPNLFAGWDRSPANNATEAQADAGAAWCRAHPLAFPPLAVGPVDDPASHPLRTALAHHHFGLLTPPGFRGSILPVPAPPPGAPAAAASRWAVHAAAASPDACILAYPPLYVPALHRPQPQADGSSAGAGAGAPAVTLVYYEVYVLPPPASRPHEVSLALGFAAMPYPAFRLPGWHRGSLAVHGDDGHRYVNDMWGGKDFLDAPLRPGQTVGLGMRFAADPAANNGLRVDVFCTRDGRRVGGWNLHEEVDAEQDLPVVGLEGFHDLSLAIGTFDQVAFEVRLDPAQWLYKGDGTA